MKVICVDKKIKNVFSDLSNGIIDKPEGIYKDIVDALPGEDGYAKNMISDIQEEEMEKRLAEEAQKNRTSDIGIDSLDLDFSANDVEIADALSYGKDIYIGYFTYNTGTYIERTIKPEYIYYAKSTGNNVLVSWCYDWNDYRAFILDNIVFVEEPNKNAIGE